MVRGQERQAIIDALPKEKHEARSREWNDGYCAAITAMMRVVVARSIIHEPVGSGPGKCRQGAP
jgi:hypothetical protein